jgi:hypothetical protein
MVDQFSDMAVRDSWVFRYMGVWQGVAMLPKVLSGSAKSDSSYALWAVTAIVSGLLMVLLALRFFAWTWSKVWLFPDEKRLAQSHVFFSKMRCFSREPHRESWISFVSNRGLKLIVFEMKCKSSKVTVFLSQTRCFRPNPDS